jgi:hypothetical protein
MDLSDNCQQYDSVGLETQTYDWTAKHFAVSGFAPELLPARSHGPVNPINLDAAVLRWIPQLLEWDSSRQFHSGAQLVGPKIQFQFTVVLF